MWYIDATARGQLERNTMIEIGNFGKVRQIRMRLEVDGAPRYWLSVYLVDGLLIDTGAKNTGGVHSTENLIRAALKDQL